VECEGVEFGREENEDQKLAKGMEGRCCVFPGNQGAECDEGAGVESVGLCSGGLVCSWFSWCFRGYLAYVG
jgi:hypothetical protein